MASLSSNQRASRASSKMSSHSSSFEKDHKTPSASSKGEITVMKEEDARSSARASAKDVRSERSSRASGSKSESVASKAASLSASASSSSSKRKKNTFSTGKSTIGESKSPLMTSSSSTDSSNLGVLSYRINDNVHDELKGFGLSSNEMREKLFSSFKSRGILNGVRKQIRADLASAINDQQLPLPNKSKVISFSAKICDCIIAEHLKRAKYEYTLSVFKAESLLSEFNFDPHEVLDVMKLSPDTKVYQKLMLCFSHERSKGFLWNFIAAVLPETTGERISVECQTDHENPTTGQLVSKKLSEIEKDIYQTGKGDITESYFSLEGRLLELQKKMEQQKKKEIKMEKENLKNGLLREMRLQEQEKNKTAIDRYKEELDTMYKEMLENLRNKQAQMEVMMSKKQKQLDDEAHEQRQNVLRELNKIKDREAEMKRQHDFAMKSTSLEESKLNSLAEELRMKEMSLKSVEERYEIKLKEEMLQMKMEQQKEKDNLDKCYKNQELKLNEEKANFETEKAILMKFRDDYESLKNDKAQLQVALNYSNQKLYRLNQSNDDLKAKLREVADYQKIREKLLLKEKELDYLKNSLEDLKKDKHAADVQHKNDIKELVDKFLKGTPEKAKLQQQILIERDEFLKKESSLKLKLKDTSKRLQTEVTRNKELISMYDECLLQNKALRREIEDLKKHRYLPSSSYRNNVKAGDTVSPFIHSPYKSLSSRKSPRYEPLEKEEKVDAAYSPHARKVHLSGNNYVSNELSAKAASEQEIMFERLEKEAAELEENYHKFKQFASSKQFEKPNVNDYKPLQKYESTFVQNPITSTEDKSKQSLSQLPIDKAADKDSRNETLLLKNFDRGTIDNGSADYQHTNNVKKNKLALSEKVLLETWNGDHLSEQLLESAVNQKDAGYTQQSIGAMSEAENDANRVDLLEVQSLSDRAEQLHELQDDDVKDQDKHDHEKLEDTTDLYRLNHSGTNLLINEEEPSEPFEENKDFSRKEMERRETVGHSSKESLPENITQDAKTEMMKSYDGTEKFEEKSVQEAFSQGKEANINLPGDEYEKNLSRSEETNGSGDESFKSDEKRGENSNEIEIALDNDDNADAEMEKPVEDDEQIEEDDHIDPLMKHYMEMVMKKKTDVAEEANGKEELNLTDDIKIESKLSKSDISDLVEDEMEEIPIESGDDFDW